MASSETLSGRNVLLGERKAPNNRFDIKGVIVDGLYSVYNGLNAGPDEKTRNILVAEEEYLISMADDFELGLSRERMRESALRVKTFIPNK